MRFAGLMVAAAVVIAANAAALLSAARNRAGTPDTVMELTERELGLEYQNEQDSGVSVRLSYSLNYADPTPWLGPHGLAALGFDTRLPDRQLPRHAYVAFEYDGSAWRKFSAGRKPEEIAGLSHLCPIDAARTGAELRRRHPDRGSVLILPCTIDARGYIRDVLTGSISVPPKFHALFAAVRSRTGRPRYALKLAVGIHYEPYVTGARLLP
ncbi:MAG: DUF4824 family protein [Acidobacteriia bacterium]|nr:DUF4824 family protein [Terriglobia bacterium]